MRTVVAIAQIKVRPKDLCHPTAFWVIPGLLVLVGRFADLRFLLGGDSQAYDVRCDPGNGVRGCFSRSDLFGALPGGLPLFCCRVRQSGNCFAGASLILLGRDRPSPPSFCVFSKTTQTEVSGQSEPEGKVNEKETKSSAQMSSSSLEPPKGSKVAKPSQHHLRAKHASARGWQVGG